MNRERREEAKSVKRIASASRITRASRGRWVLTPSLGKKVLRGVLTVRKKTSSPKKKERIERRR